VLGETVDYDGLVKRISMALSSNELTRASCKPALDSEAKERKTIPIASYLSSLMMLPLRAEEDKNMSGAWLDYDRWLKSDPDRAAWRLAAPFGAGNMT
jgi:hypothetical protein